MDETTKQLLVTIAERQPDIKQAGYEEGFSEGSQSSGGVAEVPWEVIQNGGARTDYYEGFAYWGVEELSPKHIVRPTGLCDRLFLNCTELKSIDKTKFDLSQAPYHPSDTELTSTCQVCEKCGKLEIFPDIGLQAGYYNRTFRSCKNLHTIEVLRVAEDTEFGGSAFLACTSLQNITIEGVIACSIYLSPCVALSPASMRNIIKHLKPFDDDNAYSSSITFSQTAFDALEESGVTEEDIDWLMSLEKFKNAKRELVAGFYDSWDLILESALYWDCTIQ